MINRSLEKKLRKYVKEIKEAAEQRMAQDVLFKIERDYEEVIGLFYDHYTPRRYKRTHYTYYASSGYMGISRSPISVVAQNIKKKNGGTEAGIRVSSANIPGKPYFSAVTGKPYSTEKVFSNTFVKGQHGAGGFMLPYYLLRGNSVGAPKMKRSPQHMMKTRFDLFKKGKNNEIHDFSRSALSYAVKTVKPPK